jgi:predicted dehydrogenase
MSVLVVGGGSVGHRHLLNLRAAHPGWRPVLVSRSGATQPHMPGVTLAGSVHDVDLSEVRAAILAGPATHRAELAIRLASHGVALFVEKPLAADLETARGIVTAAERHGVLLQVGYQHRFLRPLGVAHRAITSGELGRVLSIRCELGQWLPDWRPGRDYRQTVSARRELGGGALLELSRACDYARWLVGDVRSVCAVTGTFGELEVEVEDLAELLLTFECGAVGSIHVDMLDRQLRDCCRIVGTRGTLTWNASNNRVLLHQGDRTRVLYAGDRTDRNELFRSELAHFFECLETGHQPLVTGADGVEALAIVEAARQSSRTRSWIGPDQLG